MFGTCGNKFDFSVLPVTNWTQLILSIENTYAIATSANRVMKVELKKYQSRIVIKI